jgi:hypothetical protein
MSDLCRLAGTALVVASLAACSPPAAPPSPPPSIAAGLATVALSVDSTPRGARVFLDGVDTGKETPARLEVETGRDHRVALRHPDHRAFETSIFAAPLAPVEVRAALPSGAVLSVSTRPTGAQVQVDGEEPFAAPGRTRALAPGQHVVLVRAPGHVTSRKVYDLAEGTKELAVTLMAGRDAAVSSQPEGAAILVDGADIGAATPATVVLPLGKGHRLEVRKPKYANATRALPEIRPGEALQFEFRLEDAAAKTLDLQIAEVQRRLVRAEHALVRLQKQQSGFVLRRSAIQERALDQAAEEQQDRVDELSEELARLRQERLELAPP